VFAEEHHKALECDLLCKGYELKDVGRSLSWDALLSFISNLGPDSYVAKEMEPELHDWTTTFKTNKILADIYDMLAMINANLVAFGSKKQAKKPKPYPRLKHNGDKYGKEPVAPVQLRKMFVNIRRKRRSNG
jgi:hypothetical protein